MKNRSLNLFLFFLLATAFTAASAFAAAPWTAANNIIRNTVTVKYQDAGSNQMPDIVRTVDITVNLVPTTPTLSIATNLLVTPADQTINSAATAGYSYALTSNANGPDTYNLSAVVTTELLKGAGSTATTSVANLDLGATSVAAGVTITAAGTTAITVPSDSANDGIVNGIAVGDTVVIDGKIFVVAAAGIVDNGGTPGTSTITVNGNGTDAAVTVGMTIGEMKTFTLTVDPGTLNFGTDPPTDQTIVATVTAQNVATSGTPAVAAAAATDATTTTVTVAALTVNKYVRNVTTPVVGGATLALAGVTYYTTGVGGKPGEILEYAIEIINTGSGEAKDVRIEDPIATFTTYVSGSMKVWTGNSDPSAATLTAVDDGLANGDAGEFDTTGNGTVYIYAGTGGTDLTAGVGGTGGTIAATDPDDTKAFGVFRVTID